MSRALRLTVLATAFTFGIGCGSDSSGPANPNASLAGTWTLQSVNGSPLPYVVVQVGPDKIELVSDVLTVTASETFTQITTYRITEGGQVTTETIPDAGYYNRSGTAVTFVFNSDGSSGTGTLSGNTFTVALEGFSYVYRK